MLRVMEEIPDSSSFERLMEQVRMNPDAYARMYGEAANFNAQLETEIEAIFDISGKEALSNSEAWHQMAGSTFDHEEADINDREVNQFIEQKLMAFLRECLGEQ